MEAFVFDVAARAGNIKPVGLGDLYPLEIFGLRLQGDCPELR
jgi:hypothetical protein